MRREGRAGFTLLEVVVVLAVIGILAGAMAPYTIRRIEQSRIDSTEQEMERIGDGLAAYYEDCGRLPDAGVGLGALAGNEEALVAWAGPYVAGGGDIAREVLLDAWGAPYAYQPDAAVSGMDAPVSFLLISAGSDGVFDSQWTKKGWKLDTDGDMVRLGSTRDTDDEWREETEELFGEIASGLERYYLDTGGFPSGTDEKALVELVTSKQDGWNGPYLSRTSSGAVFDAWGGKILLRACEKVDGEDAEGLILLSDGPGAPAATVKKDAWRTAANDVVLVIPEGSLAAALDRERTEEALRELKLLAGTVYADNPALSPESDKLDRVDPWNNNYRYKKESDYSGRVYSFGADGKDDDGDGDDLYEALLWTPAGGP